MSWPAKLDDVICIHSANGLGRLSGITPNDNTRYRICTLGEAVPFENGGQVVYHSGTSFATPIAAAIAAIVLEFADNHGLDAAPQDFERFKSRLRTKDGMQKVLQIGCVLKDQSTPTAFAFITPWFFLNDDILIRMAYIITALRQSSGY